MRLYTFTLPGEPETRITIDLDHVLAITEDFYVTGFRSEQRTMPRTKISFAFRQDLMELHCFESEHVQAHEDMTKRLIAAWKGST